MAHTGSPAGPKVGQFFFLAAPKFYPRQKDPKRVLSAGAWGLVPKSAVWGPLNPEIRNLRPPKFGKKIFSYMYYFIPKSSSQKVSNPPAPTPVRPKLPNCSGVQFFPYADLPCGPPFELLSTRPRSKNNIQHEPQKPTAH